MSDRETRARAIYEGGMNKVRTQKYPDGQKFPPGARVFITRNMPSYMWHFECGKWATVEYTYAHAFGGGDVKSYSLKIDGHGSVAWYEEDQLSETDNDLTNTKREGE